jgi:hypothetical protein
MYTLSILHALTMTESLLTSVPRNSWLLSSRQNHIKASTLFAISSSSSSAQSVGWGGPQSVWGSRPQGGVTGTEIPSKTARESAVNVEWEPMTELERRIEDGVHYEHIPNLHHHLSKQERIPGHRTKATIPRDNNDGDLPQVRAVFCGYRYTQDDYNRLQSADVVD